MTAKKEKQQIKELNTFFKSWGIEVSVFPKESPEFGKLIQKCSESCDYYYCDKKIWCKRILVLKEDGKIIGLVGKSVGEGYFSFRVEDQEYLDPIYYDDYMQLPFAVYGSIIVHKEKQLVKKFVLDY
jgi:hypothetical protein